MRYTELTYTEKSDAIKDFTGEDEVRSVTIYEEVADLNISDFIDKFIRPLLSGVGYTEKTIEKYIGE